MEIIRSLWIGSRLSVMEQLCIASFLRNGHPFHLYTYDHVAGIPPGTVVLDGNRVLPASRIFTYREYKTYAGFANFFRYKLLLEEGGWFVDADTVCLKPFRFRTPYVFSSEGVNGRQLVNLAAVKVPPGSPVMEYAWNACERMDPSTLGWSQCGPTLLRQAAEKCGVDQYVRPWRSFCPVHFSTWEQLLDPAFEWDSSGAHAIHLWNEIWRRSGQDKDASYPEGCLYEQLKRRYL
jgi:mannosyltransferase OCH1-like enzyme